MRKLPFVTLLSLTGILAAAGSAAAGEKALDTVNIKAGPASFQVLAGVLDASSPTWDRIHTAAVDANCGAPALDSANDGMPFDIFCIEVSDTEPVQIVLDADLTSLTDTVLTLYCDPFDPAAPDRNVIAFDDDDGVGTRSALTAADDIRLVPGREYWVVVSTYGAGMYGTFRVQLGDNAFPCGGVAVDGATWGDVKGMYR